MKAKAFLLVLALQVALLIGLVAQQEFRLASGQTILLETAPVDPRDLLRGDYVILNYKITTLSRSLFSSDPSTLPPPGTPVFVLLEKRGTFHEAVSASLTPPAPADQLLMIQGKVRRSWSDGSNPMVQVDYGLERFYVREGTGNPTGKLTVEAALPNSGQAVIKQVFIDGKPYAEVMRTLTN